ncbi:hypothetical protein KBD71_05465 [Candidatus Woesebacteria bacterium]|nr:hypothetical protein [Candidatus Woesebacteria bacterium]
MEIKGRVTSITETDAQDNRPFLFSLRVLDLTKGGVWSFVADQVAGIEVGKEYILITESRKARPGVIISNEFVVNSVPLIRQ